MKNYFLVPYLSVCFLLFYGVPPLSAQGCCSGGAPLSGNLDLSDNSEGQLSIRLTYDYNNLEDVIFGKKEIEDDTRKRITNTGIFRATYALKKRIAFGLILPYIQQVEKVESITSSRTSGIGIGDLTFFGQYAFIQKASFTLTYALGIKAPTGSIDKVNEKTNFVLHPDLQPGSGAWDWFNIVQVNFPRIFRSKWNLNSRINYRFNGTSSRFNGQQEYQFGNDLQWYLGVNRAFFVGKFQLTPQVLARYRNTQADQTDGFDSPNTGGHWIYIIPGFNLKPMPNFGLGIYGEIPVYRNLDGIQLTTSYRLNFSLSYTFDLIKEQSPTQLKL